MRKLKILYIQILIFILLSQFSLKAVENKILFKIDNEIITSVDVYNEVKYLQLMNKEILNLEKEKIIDYFIENFNKVKIRDAFYLYEKLYPFSMGRLKANLVLEIKELSRILELH